MKDPHTSLRLLLNRHTEVGVFAGLLQVIK